MSFQLGDQVWLHLDKKHFKGHHQKLLPVIYGPYTIIDKDRENAYQFDLPPQLGIHNVINVNHLNLFEPDLLEEIVIITHRVDNISDFQLPLEKYTTGHPNSLYKALCIHFLYGSMTRLNFSSRKMD